MLTLLLLLLLQGAFAIWFHRRFKIAEATRLRCDHDVQAEKFKHTANLIRTERINLWRRHEELEAEIKSLKGSMYNHDGWIKHFIHKYDPPIEIRL